MKYKCPIILNKVVLYKVVLYKGSPRKNIFFDRFSDQFTIRHKFPCDIFVLATVSLYYMNIRRLSFANLPSGKCICRIRTDCHSRVTARKSHSDITEVRDARAP